MEKSKFQVASVTLLSYAKNLGVEYAYTVHDAENIAPIQLNRKLGYVDAEWDNLLA